MHLIFDLDGTLTDPQVGIVKAANYALAKFGMPARDPAFLAQFIGPPLNVLFCTLLETEDAATLAQAVVWYREYYFIDGWLPAEKLTRQLRQYFYHVGFTGASAERWDVAIDQHIVQPFWAPLTDLPPLVAPQQQWLEYVMDHQGYNMGVLA